MANEDPRPLTRKELAEFLPSQRAIRAFEKLFDIIPGDIIELFIQIEAASIDANTAGASANSALFQIVQALKKIEEVSIDSGNANARAANAINLLARLLNVLTTRTVSNHDLIEWNATNNRFELIATPYTDGMVVNNASGTAIKIDKTSPDFGWMNMYGEIIVKLTGPSSPTWASYISGLYQFSFNVNDEVFQEFQIPHNYAPNTDLYIYVDWSHNTAGVTTGDVTWAFEFTYAKGYNQAAFPASKTLSVTQTASTTQYQNMNASIQLSTAGGSATKLDTADIEVDGYLMVRVYLSANTMDAGAIPFLHAVGVHYQSTGLPTKNKAPNFYT